MYFALVAKGSLTGTDGCLISNTIISTVVLICFECYSSCENTVQYFSFSFIMSEMEFIDYHKLDILLLDIHATNSVKETILNQQCLYI